MSALDTKMIKVHIVTTSPNKYPSKLVTALGELFAPTIIISTLNMDQADIVITCVELKTNFCLTLSINKELLK